MIVGGADVPDSRATDSDGVGSIPVISPFHRFDFAEKPVGSGGARPVQSTITRIVLVRLFRGSGRRFGHFSLPTRSRQFDTIRFAGSTG